MLCGFYGGLCGFYGFNCKVRKFFFLLATDFISITTLVGEGDFVAT